jgi:hypothetical protein
MNEKKNPANAPKPGSNPAEKKPAPPPAKPVDTKGRPQPPKK